jgi:tetratricopeptide (TPR) repeat protein
MSTSRAVALFLAAALFAGTAPAAGQDAISLFKQGRALVEQNRWAEACPLFQEAHRIDPNALGILLNLADCSKQIGNTATAWTSYQEAEFIAKKTGDAGREKYAHDGAAALEPTLSRIVIHARETPGLIIRRDDQMVGKGIWGTGTAFPIDPGPHKIEATAPGYSVWSTTITVGPRNDLKTIEIPQLILSETPGPGGGPSPALRPAGFAIGGLGAAGLILGGVFGGLAMSAASKLKSDCKGNVCTTPSDQSALSSANTKALVSTVGLAAGGALLATGVVLVIVGRPRHDDTPRPTALLVPSVGPQGAGFGLVGRF